eukprot:CAMPEP_0194282514 /NCGR_PEP_ID=MMETSP0169-20130528/23269_1 /TAXON_ID=218684 /ORGANISM="Corethron pennatum, Strain L29A3" /LENGTH=962 /DNA_ID=CAMNT_0039027857 /DNA_START=253 /DNA_END=3141 /DNA_ORIENTATION=+
MSSSQLFDADDNCTLDFASSHGALDVRHLPVHDDNARTPHHHRGGWSIRIPRRLAALSTVLLALSECAVQADRSSSPSIPFVVRGGTVGRAGRQPLKASPEVAAASRAVVDGFSPAAATEDNPEGAVPDTGDSGLPPKSSEPHPPQPYEDASAAKDDIFVTKRSGRSELLLVQKIERRLSQLVAGLDTRHVDVTAVARTVARGAYSGVPAADLDVLAAETAASMGTTHPDYAALAARVEISALHKLTESTFAGAVRELATNSVGSVSDTLLELVGRRGDEIDLRVRDDRDTELTYFGFKTLERGYLLRDTKTGNVIERPQYLFMRVALGIHCTLPAKTVEEEDANLAAAYETYDALSAGLFMHASPTLFNAGTARPQLSSCFLLQTTEDSISGIYDTLKRCAVISKGAGGIGLSVHDIRASGSHIAGTGGTSNGLVPMLRVFDATSRYVDQGGGKRPGAFAVYLEPWHADIFEVLELKKNHGKEEHRARDLFYGLWIPDLFMRRVEEDGDWSLMCPRTCPGLSDCHGKEFEVLFEKYEKEGRATRTIKARELWNAILSAQVETGTPYMLFKDACNAKSNQKNLGTIKSSNLCTEIVQYTDTDEVAVCNLASICLPKFVNTTRGPYGSVTPGKSDAHFDHESLHNTVKVMVRNLNKIIDINMYPIDEAKNSNNRHRPTGIGVSGLADTFIRLGLPFDSDAAKALNAEIFETIYHAALEESCELSKRDGPYSSFAGSPASKGELQFNLWGMDDAETPSHMNPKRNSPYDWGGLRQKIITHGLRNSLLIAPMPTASTSQILGVNECFEPFSSNLYLRRVKAGEFIMANPHLLQDLTDRGLWNENLRNELMRDMGSVANILTIPKGLREIYKTVWEIRQRDIIDMAADRGRFIDQSQSMNLFISSPTSQKLTAMHFYAWKKGLKTGMYYLRTRPAAKAIQYTVNTAGITGAIPRVDDEGGCLSCQG